MSSSAKASAETMTGYGRTHGEAVPGLSPGSEVGVVVGVLMPVDVVRCRVIGRVAADFAVRALVNSDIVDEHLRRPLQVLKVDRLEVVGHAEVENLRRIVRSAPRSCFLALASLATHHGHGLLGDQTLADLAERVGSHGRGLHCP